MTHPPTTCFCKWKLYWNTAVLIYLHIVFFLLSPFTAKFTQESLEQGHMAHKACSVCSVALYGKSLPTPVRALGIYLCFLVTFWVCGLGESAHNQIIVQLQPAVEGSPGSEREVYQSKIGVQILGFVSHENSKWHFYSIWKLAQGASICYIIGSI